MSLRDLLATPLARSPRPALQAVPAAADIGHNAHRKFLGHRNNLL